MIRYHNTTSRRFPRSTQEAFSWERSSCLYGPYVATRTRMRDVLMWVGAAALLVSLLFAAPIGRALGFWA